MKNKCYVGVLALVLSGCAAAGAGHAAGLTFTNLSEDPATGIDFERISSPREEGYFQYLDLETGAPRADIPFADLALAPTKSRGAPGVCLFDFDGDGDEDIYATNGPGAANSLYSNQMVETGLLTFVDVALAAGVDATAQDSSGCVAGDLDNDGDRDLYVLSTGEDNLLLENHGDGTFSDITLASQTGGEARWATSASLCDVNSDGLLDIAVGNTFDMLTSEAILTVATDLNEHNQLFVNVGGNVFVDMSAESGLEDLAGMRMLDEDGFTIPIPGKPAGITWSIACVDYDLDGDMDILTGDDQAGVPTIGGPPSPFGSAPADRGLVHIFQNDGTGSFVDVNDQIDTTMLPGSWMGLSFADYNSDGHMDFFNSNFGDANLSLAMEDVLLGVQPSRWFLGDGNGGFVDSLTDGVVPGVVSTPFGWGTSSVDYDNDGDSDILFVGDIEAGPFVTSSNPVAIWDNDGAANFTANVDALTPEDADLHKRSAEHGMAVGDLDADGFLDFVTVSNFVIPADYRDPQPPFGVPLLLPNPFDFGGAYDADTEFMPTFAPTVDEMGEPTGLFSFIPSILEVPNGVLNVERNNGENGNGSVQIEALGTVGITSGGEVNRDGIGAVFQFTPQGGMTAMQAVLGGAGYAQQDSLIRHFGLGEATGGTVDVLWPGGVRNRLHRVADGRRVLFPEIPCSIDTDAPFPAYLGCVTNSLDEIHAAGVISSAERYRFLLSAILGYNEEH